MSDTSIGIILAINNVGTIGDQGSIPWHVPDDLARFKRICSGNSMLIGRKTHESLQHLHPQYVAGHDRKVKEKWDYYEQKVAEIKALDLSPGKLQRSMAKLSWLRDESLRQIYPVYQPFTLPHRKTIVVSSTLQQPDTNPDLTIVSSVENALEHYRRNPHGKLICAGGAELYKQFWRVADTIWLTVVENKFEGDTKLDLPLNDGRWRVAATQQVPTVATEENPVQTLSHTYITLKRK